MFACDWRRCRTTFASAKTSDNEIPDCVAARRRGGNTDGTNARARARRRYAGAPACVRACVRALVCVCMVMPTYRRAHAERTCSPAKTIATPLPLVARRAVVSATDATPRHRFVRATETTRWTGSRAGFIAARQRSTGLAKFGFFFCLWNA